MEEMVPLPTREGVEALMAQLERDGRDPLPYGDAERLLWRMMRLTWYAQVEPELRRLGMVGPDGKPRLPDGAAGK